MLRPRFVPVDEPALKETSAQRGPAHYELPLYQLSSRLQVRQSLHALASLAAVVAIAGVAFLVLRCYAGSLRTATTARHSERRLASGEGGQGPWPFGGSGELEKSCEEPAEQGPPRPPQGGRHQPLPPATAGAEAGTSGAVRRPGTRPTGGKDMAKMRRLYKKEALKATHLRHDHPYDLPSSSDESTPRGSPTYALTSTEGKFDVDQSDCDTVSQAADVSREREGSRGAESSSSEGESSHEVLSELDAAYLAFLHEIQSVVFEEESIEAEEESLLDLLWTTSDVFHASPERQAPTEALAAGMPLVTGVSAPMRTDQQEVTSIPPSSGRPCSSKSQQETPFGRAHEESSVEKPSSSKKRKRLEEYGKQATWEQEAPETKRPHFPSATGSTSQALLTAKEEHVSPSDSGQVEKMAGASGEEQESSGTESSALKDQDSSELLNELLEEYLGETLHGGESFAARQLLLQPEEEASLDFILELLQKPQASTQREATAEAAIAGPSTGVGTTQPEGHAQPGPSTDVEATQDDLTAPQSEPRPSSFAMAMQQENRSGQHPFVLLPRGWPHGMAFPGDLANVHFTTRPKSSFPVILNSIRAILAKDILNVEDMKMLSASAFQLMGYIGCCLARKVESVYISYDVVPMARRFLAGYYLLAACQVLGPTMRLEEWWHSRMRLPLSPPSWWTEAHSHHLQEGRSSELLQSLVKGVQILSKCQLPPPALTVHILRSLLCQERILQYFTHPAFASWREMDAGFISETSPDSASASSGDED
ncbi:hypothetical protein Efla_001983 [Eimeria flavescens]